MNSNKNLWFLSTRGFVIFCISIYIISNISNNAYADLAYNPDYDLFKEHLMVAAIFFVFIYVITKIVIKYSAGLTRSQLIKNQLNSSFVEYIMMICLSTVSFYTIGAIFYFFLPFSRLAGYWVDAILIDAVIISLLVFILDILIIRPLRNIIEYFNPTESTFPTTRSNKGIYLGSFILAILVICYSILFIIKQ